jgi:hypothetical protein
VDWTRYGVGKVIDVLTFIPRVGQLLFVLESRMNFFLQGMSKV